MLSITQACTFEHWRYSMETKLEYLLDSGNTLNMFEIQKYWEKIFQKDGICIPKYTAEHWTYSALQHWELYFLQVSFCFEISLFLRFVGF